MNAFNHIAYADPFRINMLNHGREFGDVGFVLSNKERMFAPRISGVVSALPRAESGGYVRRMTGREFHIVVMSTYSSEIVVV